MCWFHYVLYSIKARIVYHSNEVLFHSKYKSSPSQQLSSNVTKGSDLFCKDYKKHIRALYRQTEEYFKFKHLRLCSRLISFCFIATKYEGFVKRFASSVTLRSLNQSL